jgi:LysR family transcriptional activator of glutamate synthase operon
MNLHQLRYFSEVARSQNITRTSEQLYISQPSLSKTIASLESELGVKLFDRIGKSIVLNASGKVFLEKIRKAQDLMKKSSKSEEKIKLYVTGATRFIPDLVSRFSQLHPEVTFDIIGHHVVSSKLDFHFNITSVPAGLTIANSVHLYREEIVLVVPLGHPFAQEKSIHLQRAANEHFVCLRGGHSFRQITDTLCRLVNFTPMIVCESDDPFVVRSLIKEKLSVAFFPRMTWNDILDDSIVPVSISYPNCSRDVVLLSHSDLVMSPFLEAFRDFTAEYFHDLAAKTPGSLPVRE